MNEQLEQYHQDIHHMVEDNKERGRIFKATKQGWNCNCYWWNSNDRQECWLCGTHKSEVNLQGE